MGQLLAPQRYVEWMNQHLRFNPRGQQQSDFLSRCIVDDLRTLSIKLSQDLDIFRINYHDNMTIWSLVVDRVVDMAFADPKEPGTDQEVDEGVQRGHAVLGDQVADQERRDSTRVLEVDVELRMISDN